MFRVLIADDETAVKRSLNSIITTELPDFKVVGMAGDGAEALALLEKTGADLLITDIVMPVMDGLRLVQEIRERGLNTEIVMISGYSEPAYFRHALRSSAADYLIKPLDYDEVAGTLARIAAKLRKQQNGLRERSDWASVCKPVVGRLASSIWLLNPEAVARELEHLRQLIQSQSYQWYAQNEMTMDLLMMLNAELSGLSGNRLRLERFEEFHSIRLSENVKERVDILLDKVMDEIRRMRNWGTHKTIRSALEQIHRSYMNEASSLKEIAKSVDMSPNYFSKCFREEVGISYSQYITQLRMKKAIDLLNDPAFKIYEVAHATGFSDYAHFAKVFKKKYEFSPTEYRTHIGII